MVAKDEQAVSGDVQLAIIRRQNSDQGIKLKFITFDLAYPRRC